jgi:hypothetical protein
VQLLAWNLRTDRQAEVATKGVPGPETRCRSQPENPPRSLPETGTSTATVTAIAAWAVARMITPTVTTLAAIRAVIPLEPTTTAVIAAAAPTSLLLAVAVSVITKTASAAVLAIPVASAAILKATCIQPPHLSPTPRVSSSRCPRTHRWLRGSTAVQTAQYPQPLAPLTTVMAVAVAVVLVLVLPPPLGVMLSLILVLAWLQASVAHMQVAAEVTADRRPRAHRTLRQLLRLGLSRAMTPTPCLYLSPCRSLCRSPSPCHIRSSSRRQDLCHRHIRCPMKIPRIRCLVEIGSRTHSLSRNCSLRHIYLIRSRNLSHIFPIHSHNLPHIYPIHNPKHSQSHSIWIQGCHKTGHIRRNRNHNFHRKLKCIHRSADRATAFSQRRLIAGVKAPI